MEQGDVWLKVVDLDCRRSQCCGSDRTCRCDCFRPAKEQTNEGERKKASKQARKEVAHFMFFSFI